MTHTPLFLNSQRARKKVKILLLLFIFTKLEIEKKIITFDSWKIRKMEYLGWQPSSNTPQMCP
jgi:hypothetical protein